jgi:hypothetical protein
MESQQGSTSATQAHINKACDWHTKKVFHNILIVNGMPMKLLELTKFK